MAIKDNPSSQSEHLETSFGPGLPGLRALATDKGRRSLWLFLLLSIVIAIALPLANVFVVFPAFTDILVHSIEEDTEKIAAYLVPPELKFSEITKDRLTPKFYGDIYKLEHDFGIIKVKILSPDGEVLYSTETGEIGSFISGKFFTDIVSKGQRFTVLLKRGGTSMQGKRVMQDIVETYLPLMNGTRFLGAFELYYDITETKTKLDTMLLYSTLVMTLLSLSLVAAILFLLRKEAATKVARQREQQLKDDIERITRHDLKAPMISVLSGVEYLKNFTELNEDQTSLISQMREAAHTGLDMINRSLGLYRMEMETYEYVPEKMDMLFVVRRVISALSALAAMQGAEILITSSGEVVHSTDSLPFQSEEPLCYTLLANLVKNAIEASEHGDRIVIDIADVEGIKITIHNPAPVPEAIRKTFFKKYATSGKAGGTGLGTYSAKLMVQAMGGTLDMETSEESGTLVTVHLPWPPEPENDKEA